MCVDVKVCVQPLIFNQTLLHESRSYCLCYMSPQWEYLVCQQLLVLSLSVLKVNLMLEK